MLSPRFSPPGTSGSYKSAGLPNIIGETIIGTHDDWVQSGAFKLVHPDSITGVYTPTTLSLKMIDCRLDFNASKSNSIYGASTTVQPPSFTTLYIIKY